MEELGTAVTSADALCKGDQGMGGHVSSVQRLPSMATINQGSSISLHPEQPPPSRAVCRLATHLGTSHPPSQLHRALLVW